MFVCVCVTITLHKLFAIGCPKQTPWTFFSNLSISEKERRKYADRKEAKKKRRGGDRQTERERHIQQDFETDRQKGWLQLRRVGKRKEKKRVANTLFHLELLLSEAS